MTIVPKSQWTGVFVLVLLIMSLNASATAWYVDASNGSDAANGLSWTAAKKTIQAAIDVSSAGDEIIVTNGIYSSITANDTTITIRSVNGAEHTIIDGGGIRSCAVLSSDVELTGFTIQNGYANGMGAHAGVNTGIIRNCILRYNEAHGYGASAGLGGGSAYNCLFFGNTFFYDQETWDGLWGGGTAGWCALHNCTIVNNNAYGVWDADVYNSIVWGNAQDIYASTPIGGGKKKPVYSCHGSSDYQGEGCITNNPLFVNASNHDYHLSEHSPCINSGILDYTDTENLDLDGKVRVVGNQVDMGCYEYCAHTRIETKAAKAPSCTADGWTHEVKCSRCGTMLEASTTVSALGHIEVETKAAKAPTCTADGWTHEVSCSRCEEVLEASTTLTALGHIEVETKTAKTPTCTADGWTHEESCSRCHVVLEESEHLSALGHCRSETASALAPTCTAYGRTPAFTRCSRCGEDFPSQTISPLGHFGVVTKPEVEPAFGEEGLTAEIACARCGMILQEQKEVDALEPVRNVAARQLWPHKKVEVCFDVGEDISDVAGTNDTFVLACSYGGVVRKATHLHGDTSLTPGQHVLAWDLEADGIAIDSTNVTFSVGVGPRTTLVYEPGLSVKYYDISLSGYSTWTQSEVAMMNYFSGRTPTIVTNTVGWGDTLQSGFQQNANTGSYFSNYPDLWLAYVSTNRYHGKYANSSQDCFAMLFEGALWVDAGGTYYFAAACDDEVVLYVDGTRIVASSAWRQTPQPGSISLSPGMHGISIATYENTGSQGMWVEWKKPDDSSYSPLPQSALSQSAMNVSVFDICSLVSGISVDTSSVFHDGMNVSGAMELGYSPFEGGEATILIDGATAVSAAESGVFVWQPRTPGPHTLQHVSGTNTWTRTVSVTSLAFDEPAEPNPPTEADENIVLSSTSRHFAKGGGSSSIVTSGSGTWTASASASWITIPTALSSRNAGLPVVYQVAASDRAEPRTGYVYVSGHVFTVTQDGVGATMDSYSADFGPAGGTGSFTVLAGAQTGWQAKSNVDWISVGTTVGTGEAAVSFTVAPLHSVATRTGTITAAGCTFTVNQTGRRLAISATDSSYTALGLTADRDYTAHVVAIVVTAASDTTWDVDVDASWLSVADAGSGHGGGTVAVAANENPSWLARTGRVRIGTETLVVRQAGRPAGAETLSFAISPAETTASVKGANGLIAVMATPDLPWSAESRANWLTVMPGARSGAGNGNVVYAASPNPMLSERTGAIEVAPVEESALPAQTHAVTQPAAVAEVSATAHAFAAAGESFGVEVACDDVVQWTVEEACDWLSVAGSTNRVGSGTAVLEAAANPTVDARSATVTIAGHSFVATQKGRSVEVEYGARVFEPEGGYDAVEVHPDGNVTWKAVSSAPDWLSIWGGANCTYDDDGNVIGTGDDTIEYIVAEYVGDGSSRMATITIGDKTVYVTQRAYDLSISPSAAQVGGNAGAGEIGVSASVGDIWNAIAAEPWITIVSGYDAGSGSGTVRFSYTDNDTGETRTGRIIVAGEEYTLTQAARQLVSVSARVASDSPIPGAVPGAVSGTGRYDSGTSVTLRATPSDGYAFVNWTLPNGSTRTGATLSVTANANQEIVANFHRIHVYDVNGEGVREGTSMTFAAPADILDAAGTTKLVCLGTSRYPDRGRSFTFVVTEDIVFEWDLWQTNYLVSITQTTGGTIKRNGSTAADFWATAGSTVDLAATPDSGKTLFRWKVESGSPGVLAPPDAANAAGTPLETLYLCVDRPLAVSAVFGVFDDTLAEALDAPALAFTTGGDADWAPVVDATAQTGYTSAHSGAGGADTDTWLDLSLEGSGTLSFRWRTDCEKDDGGGATWDRLAVFVNGIEFSRIDGKTDWQAVTIPVSGPKTTVRWSFYRDDWDDPGPPRENAGWIDGVTFTTEGL